MIGTTVEHYRILEKIGEGGMGAVFKARDVRLDRFVAVKILQPGTAADPERRRRFLQEAKTASALNHPHIVHIYDVGTADGLDFLAMEFIEGRTLDVHLARFGGPGPARLREALRLAAPIAEALALAHQAGVLHRDLKPSNIMIDEHGVVKILDFGLAKLLEEAVPPAAATRTERPVTESGTIVGTAAYMSPEQAEGRTLDRRSDIFSFGSLLYEMAAGKRAFTGDSKISTLGAVLYKEPDPLGREVPEELKRIIRRCLVKDPGGRYPDMAEVRDALEVLAEESGTRTPALRRRARRPRRRILIASAAGLFFLAAGAWLFLHKRQAPAAPVLVTPLTSAPSLETGPSFSPDGNLVAYGWDGPQADNFDIYVKMVGQPEPLRLTKNPAWDGSPAFSPDGRSIAFIRKESAGLDVLLVPAIGGPEQRVCRIEGDVSESSVYPQLSWFPDGRWLAVEGLSIVSLETGEIRPLTGRPSGTATDLTPAVSPDGRRVVFARTKGVGVSDLYSLELGPDKKPLGEPKRLTTLNRSSHSPAWTPDGRSLLFASGALGQWAIWRVDLSDGRPTPSPGFGLSINYWPAVSPRGGRAAFVRQTRDTNIWRMPLVPEGAKSGPPEKIIASTREELIPRYSPDGRKIVFITTRTGSFGVWVCDADGSNPKEVFSRPNVHSGTPRWSPDGRSLVFDSSLEGQFDIYTIVLDGGHPRRLTQDPGDHVLPSFSRDGRWIYFAANRKGGYNIWRMPADGGPAVPVTRGGGHCALESADGRTVYFTRTATTVSALWSVPTAGGEEREVLPGLAQRSFDPAAEGIYFLAPPDAEGKYALSFKPLAGGPVRRLAVLPRKPYFGLSIAPDGRFAIYPQIDAYGSEIMLVENFR